MSGTQLVIMAVAMGLMYWIARGMIGGYFAFFFIASPIVVGVVAGLIYGDLTKGLISAAVLPQRLQESLRREAIFRRTRHWRRQPSYRLLWQRGLRRSRR